ncbi:DNA-binding GntR family transcriptional regulator [Halanaerobium saccharolyticum]|uniref:DNA-binding GntR family transcriptional regulator n=1 Tax=Halanaerobium saccharolyticum TaxID=43595 RepID=A0A4R7YW51_9FIRM|nr:GntR family transcriptional regulator [Halanaerobium saccharolyticum]RAK07177.1 DNA-binding GntR family transcriptional regulator [Halanaerobium saccharolyticum]TDW02090.1 DNA-binding GntR family transcriptional regulator [Halanaerobium saccharolyticum]TDX58821.1 DNA-binding GntR family transcriptional regulator [Halanaerobium saccharolyticum]
MNLAKHDQYKNLNMKDYVYNVLKENIMNLSLKPGTALRKKEIAKEFGVSRTPIREAFVKLKEEGLIDVYPQRGTFVSYIDLDKVQEAKFMREALETKIVKLACEVFPEEKLFDMEANLRVQEMSLKQNNYIKLFDYDNEFHKMLFEGCNKGNIWNAIEQLSTHLNRMRMLSLSADFNRSDVIEDHQRIINAIEDRNPVEAEKVMDSHISRIKFDQEKLKRDYPDYFV